MTNCQPKTANRIKGFSLIEALITAIILAFGMLGVASLQLSALRATSNANMQTAASDIVRELSDRMRANPHYYGDGETSPYEIDAAVACDEAPKSCEDYSCSQEEMAAYDLYQVSCVNGINSLPQGDISIDCEFTTGKDPIHNAPLGANPCTITVSWIAVKGSDQADAKAKQEYIVDLVPGAPNLTLKWLNQGL